MDTQVIWIDGDPWRDLGDDINDAGRATVISEHGTAHLIDTKRRRTQRLPLEGGHVMEGDTTWCRYDWIEATPCGLAVVKMPSWSASTRLRLVVRGVVPNWPATTIGRGVLADVLAHRKPRAPGHPRASCDAAYCARGQHAS